MIDCYILDYAEHIQNDASNIYFAFVFNGQASSWAEVDYETADIDEQSHIQIQVSINGASDGIYLKET